MTAGRILATILAVVLAVGCGAYPEREGTQRPTTERGTAPTAEQALDDPSSALPTTALERERTFGVNPIVPAIVVGLLLLAALVLGIVTVRRVFTDRHS